MRRIHSNKSIKMPVPKDAIWHIDRRGPGKPPGFWYGFEKSWVEWCLAESFNLKSLKHHYEIIVDESRILQLATPEAVRNLTLNLPNPDPLLRRLNIDLDWEKLSEKWDGIEVVPYQWSCRLDHKTSWYYSWDVACGCIWRASAIREIHRILDLKIEDQDTA